MSQFTPSNTTRPELNITDVDAEALDVAGGAEFGSGNVELVGTDGKLSGPLSTTIIDDLSAANLTHLNLGQGDNTGTVAVARGGTGATTLTDGGVLLGSGTSAVSALAVLTDGQMIVGDGSGDPVAESGATLRTSIGVGTGDSPTFTAVTAGQVDITGEGDLRLQDNTGGQYVGFDAPATVSGTYTLTMPAAIGAVDEALTINNTDGTLQWAAAGGSAAGSDTQVQFNDGGTSFGGDAGLTYNKTTDVLSVGSGVGFPATQSASAGANVLDDYEEGDWTPVIGGTSGQSGQSYSAQVGKYVKIGRAVYLTCKVLLSTKGTISGDGQLSGFPFTSANVTNQQVATNIGTFFSTNQAGYQWSLRHDANTATASCNVLHYSGDGTLLTSNDRAFVTGNVDDDTGFAFSHIYFV